MCQGGDFTKSDGTGGTNFVDVYFTLFLFSDEYKINNNKISHAFSIFQEIRSQIPES